MAEIAEVIEAEPVDTALLPVGQVSIYASQEPKAQLKEARDRAKILVEVVKEQGLAQSFGANRKPHVQVEGWTFLASQFGLIPDIEWTRELENGWEARAVLRRLSDGVVITHAESECRRNEEKGGSRRWEKANSYEIRSMAQTRATSKVCRNALSSVMVLAGFSATPAEEMDGRKTEAPKSADEPHCPACLAVNGELVAVSRADKKPYWRCVRRGKECAGWREHNGKTYSWSGWHTTWEASVKEWSADHPERAGPQTKTVDERGNWSQFIVAEIMSTLNVPMEDARPMSKSALHYALAENRIDPEPALGEPVLSTEFTDDQLRAIITNITPADAEVVVGAAAELFGGGDASG